MKTLINTIIATDTGLDTLPLRVSAGQSSPPTAHKNCSDGLAVMDWKGLQAGWPQ